MTRTRRLRGRAAGLLLLLAACDVGSARRISASTYLRECKGPGDCVAITEGEVSCCGLLGACPNAGIHVNAAPAYYEDVRARMPMCAAPTCGNDPVCPKGLMMCEKETCSFRLADAPETIAATTVTAADYGQACESVADCVAVVAGQLGCCPSCPNAAIRQDGFARYEHDRDLRTPACVPAASCMPGRCGSSRVDCVDGACVLHIAPPPPPPVGGTGAGEPSTPP